LRWPHREKEREREREKGDELCQVNTLVARVEKKVDDHRRRFEHRRTVGPQPLRRGVRRAGRVGSTRTRTRTHTRSAHGLRRQPQTRQRREGGGGGAGPPHDWQKDGWKGSKIEKKKCISFSFITYIR